MRKRVLAVAGCLLLSATVTSVTAATKLFLTLKSVGEMIVSVDPSLHQEFGLSYPVTYKLGIPTGSSDLVAYCRHLESEAWALFPEKTTDNFFNGEEVVRFDYDANVAYVSAAFDSSSDDIFLRITDRAGQPVSIEFQNICPYYDNRQAAVTITADDWQESTNLEFVQAVHTLRSYRLPVTAAIITGGCTQNTWQTIQQELDSGSVEAASHTRTHVNPPYADPISEILGSKQDLLANLVMPPTFRNGSQGYVYSWIAPYGSTTPQTEVVVGQARYLVDRLTYTSNGNFTVWDTAQRRYAADGKTIEMGPLYGGVTNVSLLNSLFNQSLAGGNIYHLLIHPHDLAATDEWSKPYLPGHLAYISNRTNVWYANFGTLYAYHLLQDDSPGTIQIVSGAPSILVQPVSATARQKQTATFSVTAIGSAPLAHQWQKNGLDIPGANGALYTTPALTQADSSTFFRCVVSNGLGSVTSNSATLLVLPPVINVLTNGSFESGTSPWVFYSNGSATLTQVPFGIDGINSARLNIALQGTDVQLYQANLALQPNTDYQITFAAYSNSGHDFEVSLSKHVSPYTDYGLAARRFDIGASWENFSVTFTTKGFSGSVTDGRLWFSLAPYDTTGDVYYIDNVVLARVSDVAAPRSFAPTITVQPVAQTVTPGQTATFTVGATGTAPLNYQWQKNSAEIAGATSFSYTTPAITVFDGGVLYRCHISNTVGAVNSAEVHLTVINPKPPVVTTEPRDTTVEEGHSVHFTVAAAGDAPLTYQWQRNGGDIAGAVATSYSIAAAANADSGAGFRCIISNNTGTDTSRVAYLFVRSPLPIPKLIAPAMGDTNQPVSPVLSWHLSPGGYAYEVQVSTDSTFASRLIVNDSTIADTTDHVSGLSVATQYFWHVKAMATNAPFSLPWSFTTMVGPASTPVLVSPVNGTAGLGVASIDFVWQSARWATTYRLQIAADSLFASGIVLDDSTLTETSRTVATLHTDRRYFWRVSASGPGGSGSYSGAWSFETMKTAPLAATLVSPANGASGLPVVGLSFRWTSVPSATNYGFQLGTDSTFATGLFKNDTGLADTSRTVSGLQTGTRYFWRVRARNTAGWGIYSPAWVLTTLVPLPGQVSLVSPPSGSLAIADSSTFTWHRPTPGARVYWCEIGMDSLFTSLRDIDSTLTDTTRVFRPLLNGRWYYWRVRGWNPGGWGPFSETRSIQVIISSVADRPGVPQTFALEQNHPNPFNPSTKIGFSLPHASEARLEIYNMLGQNISTILDQHLEPGYYTVTFDASALPSGVYIYRLVTYSGALVRKMVLVK